MNAAGKRVTRRRGNRNDERGRVVIRVVLWNGQTAVRGNITRQMTLSDAKVSETFKQIEELFPISNEE